MKNLFVTTALALAVSFSGVAVVAPSTANACGGYGVPTASDQVRTVVKDYVVAAITADAKAIAKGWGNLSPAAAKQIAADYHASYFTVKSVRILDSDLALATVDFSCEGKVCIDVYTVRHNSKSGWTILHRESIRTLAAFAAPAKR